MDPEDQIGKTINSWTRGEEHVRMMVEEVRTSPLGAEGRLIQEIQINIIRKDKWPREELARSWMRRS